MTCKASQKQSRTRRNLSRRGAKGTSGVRRGACRPANPIAIKHSRTDVPDNQTRRLARESCELLNGKDAKERSFFVEIAFTCVWRLFWGCVDARFVIRDS